MEIHEFKYLGSTIQSNGECFGDVMEAGWVGGEE